MSASNFNFRFYATLLDSFQSYLNTDRIWEEFWGSAEDPAISLDDFAKKQEEDLINHINRVPFVSEPASCGTAFNEIVDCIILGRPSEKEGLIIKSDKQNNIIHAELDGFSFDFDADLCKSTAKYFFNTVPQYRCSAPLECSYGLVELYGNIDYLDVCKVYDLKTTKNYSFGKFQDHWQRYAYPYCLLKSGDCTYIKEFEYTVLKLKTGGGVITADDYKEVYSYDHKKSVTELTEMCEAFCRWLLLHKDRITDKKIFGGENDAV